MSGDWKLQGVTVCADGADKQVLLHDVNMQCCAGEITLLLGHNGAGKSTLLETMAGIHTLQKGNIELGAGSLWIQHGRKAKLNLDVTLKLGISMQHSEAQWFASTVREEMLYSLKPYRIKMDTSEMRMEEALAKVGLEKELLARDPWTLSGGQQRRLSLACLLACEPDWLLLDEPTAGLDASGISSLCAVLKAHKAAGRGVVVATHDLDALMPLADAVLVVSGGVVREAACSAAIAHKAAAPQALRALSKLCDAATAGWSPQTVAQRTGSAPWPEPREVAAALAIELAKSTSERRLPTAAMNAAVVSTEGELQSSSSDKSVITPPPLSNEQQRGERFDPRSLIMMYLLLTTGVLAQQNFLQLAIAAVIIIALLIPFRALIQPWVKVIRAYVILIIVLSGFSGISLQPLEMDWENTLPTTLRLSQLLLVMLLGMPLLKLMTPLRLQRAIEQTFGWLSRIKVPIYSFALLVTLIFRFIPLLTGEWERYAKLAHARGKAVTPLRSVPIRMIRSIIIPYVRSILRLAEQMADALEARGFGYTKRKPSFGFRLRFGRADAILISIAIPSTIVLLLLPVMW